MGKHSHIEWTHHTFNPWWGCAKVSPACQHCYAEAWAKRVEEDSTVRDDLRRERIEIEPDQSFGTGRS